MLPANARIIIISAAGAKFAVRVLPSGRIDRDRAFTFYAHARSYAETVKDKLEIAVLDDRCKSPSGGAYV